MYVSWTVRIGLERLGAVCCFCVCFADRSNRDKRSFAVSNPQAINHSSPTATAAHKAKMLVASFPIPDHNPVKILLMLHLLKPTDTMGERHWTNASQLSICPGTDA
jgi:hypothetical protein